MYFPGGEDFIFNKRCISTELKFSLWPRRCHITNKLIWLKKGYRRIAMYTGPGDPIFEHRWYDKHEFLMQTLKDAL